MKRFIGYAIAAAFIAITVVYTAAALGASAETRRASGCAGIRIIIADSLKNNIVTQEEVLSFLGGNTAEYLGKPIEDIDLKKIEEKVNGQSAILKSEAYVTKDGLLNIEITQRTPVIRLGSVYSDASGYLFPVREGYPADVPEAEGRIPLKITAGYKGEARTAEERQWVKGMLSLVSYIGSNRRDMRGFRKISVRDNGDLVLHPDGEAVQFIFGQPDEIAKKFKKIRLYYTKIVPEKGAETYSSVNLKYDRQIICRK